MRSDENRKAAAAFAAASGSHDVLVARQPIFDGFSKVVAHELLYRPTAEDIAAGTVLPGPAATARVILAAISDFGLERLVGDADVHINLSAELIREPIDIPLPPTRMVLEVLEDVEADAAVIAGLQAYKARGFRIALDDFAAVPGQGDQRLLGLADFVKIDILLQPADTLADLVADLRARKIGLIAEKVESGEQFDRCRAMGFAGFQGFFLQRPETFKGQRTQGFKPATLQVIAALQTSDCSVEEIEKLVSRDVALVTRLLRSLNSAYYGFPSPVSSVRHGINLVGRDNLLKLCAILTLAAFRDRPSWLLGNTLMRARMCERLRSPHDRQEAGAFFMAGMLSHLDALLGVPLEEAIGSLGLAPAVSEALLAREGGIGRTLAAVEAYERGRWDAVMAAGFRDLAAVRAAYLEAVGWSEETLKLTVE
jgi:EAL and modified HD-GYP domain-containing signal transduction protein